MSNKSNPKADVHNPNNPSYKMAIDHRSKQLNPEFNENHPINVKLKTEKNKKK